MVSTTSEPSTGDLRRALGAGDRATAGRDLHRGLAGLAAEHVVVLLLEAGDARAVDVRASDHAAPGVAARQRAPILAVDRDAGEVEVARAGRRGRRRPGGRRTTKPFVVSSIAATSSSRRSSSRPSTVAKTVAVPSGSVTCLGFTATVLAGTDRASSSPLRSKIEPAGRSSGRVLVHCALAALRRLVALDGLQQADLDEDGRQHDEHDDERGDQAPPGLTGREPVAEPAGPHADRAAGALAGIGLGDGRLRRADLDRPLGAQDPGRPGEAGGRRRARSSAARRRWSLAAAWWSGRLDASAMTSSARRLARSGSRRAAGDPARRPAGAPTRRGSSAGRCVLAAAVAGAAARARLDAAGVGPSSALLRGGLDPPDLIERIACRRSCPSPRRRRPPPASTAATVCGSTVQELACAARGSSAAVAASSARRVGERSSARCWRRTSKRLRASVDVLLEAVDLAPAARPAGCAARPSRASARRRRTRGPRRR